jgi:hypothetical protein
MCLGYSYKGDIPWIAPTKACDVVYLFADLLPAGDDFLARVHDSSVFIGIGKHSAFPEGEGITN